MFRLLILLALILLPGMASVANACSCLSANATCNQSWKADSYETIFLGKVVSSAPDQQRLNPPGTYPVSKRLGVRFSVTETLGGLAAAGKEIVVYTGNGGGDCGYPFVVGKSYLVYAYRDNEDLETGICNPTSPEVLVAAVIRQLRAMQRGQRVADLFGTIGTGPRGNGYEDRIETTPLGEIRVRVIGNDGDEHSTVTDQDGIFAFQSLPPDTYRMEVDLPDGMSTWERNEGKAITVKIGSGDSPGCRTDLFARPNGRISGCILDENGLGRAGFVTYELADPKEAEAARRRGGGMGYTTEDGSFKLWLIPPGRYRLKFSPMVDGKVSFREPPHLSEVVELGFGQHIEDFRFTIPRKPARGTAEVRP